MDIFNDPNNVQVAAMVAVFLVIRVLLRMYLKPVVPTRNMFEPDLKYWKKRGKPDENVIKIGYKNKVKKEYDVIIVGSGLGGLSAGVLLAKAGKRVCILEQHDRAGGCSHVFKEHGWEWDVGLHYVGRIGNPIHKNRIISDVMTDGKLEWNRLDHNYDTAVICNEKIKFYGNLDETKQSLYKHFPKEKKAIDRYFELAQQCLKETDDAFDHVAKPMLPLSLRILLPIKRMFEKNRSEYWMNRTTQSVLDECTKNKKLQAALVYNWGDIGTPPGKSSFWYVTSLFLTLMHATTRTITTTTTTHTQNTNNRIMASLQYHFWTDGAFYPVGGPVKLAQHAIPIIQRNGGGVFVRAPVSRILLNKGRAVGVQIDNGGPRVMAPVVISNCGMNVTWNKLLPKVLAQKHGYDKLCKKIGPSFAGVSLFVGFDKTTQDLNLPSTNMWIFPGDKIEDMDIEAKCKITKDSPPLLFLGFPSSKDPEYTKRNPGKGVASIISAGTFDEFAEWQSGRVKKRGKEYEKVKKRITDNLLEEMYKHFPQCRGHVAYTELGTPLTNKHYLGYERGEIYGLDHTTSRFGSARKKLSPVSPIPGLYFTGQDILTAGITSAMTSGIFAAGAVLKRNLYFELRDESKRRRAREGKKGSSSSGGGGAGFKKNA